MEELTNKHIKDILEKSPLYAWKEFKKPEMNRSSLWIKEIDAFCETCQQIRPFQDMEKYGSGAGMPVKSLSTGQSSFKFTCVSCRKEHHKYLVDQIVSESTIKIQKYGELPRKHLEKDKLLKKFFSGDSDNYEKAMVCISHGYGIGSFSYLRRIIEGNIFQLLDMLQEDIECSENVNEIKDAIAELRKESPMSDKIKLANNALPSYLKPDGLNPLGKLYQILSEGVHNLSDEECLEKATAIKECLKFLISELTSRKQNRSRFKSLIGSL